MKWRKTLLVLSFAWCLFSLSLSAQEPPSPTAAAQPSEQPQPTLSQKLRGLAERLKQATSESRGDLDALLTERQMLSGDLERLQTEASGLESDSRSMREFTSSLSTLLTNSIKREQATRRARNAWRIATLIAGSLVVVESVLVYMTYR